jgi:hypothetical protein
MTFKTPLGEALAAQAAARREIERRKECSHDRQPDRFTSTPIVS